ncbi:GH92 family glycosyl hydrolase [Reichenbachiella sp. MALMAid0571]|uniref:GH92 family glycosyl hydrolase n=1 Tax=Reichenbachiella sp. MALMAid0571 TaxID=3143939 RepID=UPI0032DE72D1
MRYSTSNNSLIQKHYITKIYCGVFLLLNFSCHSTKDTRVRETDYSKYVNVFLGVEKCDNKDGIQIAENLPRIDTSWFDVREIYGATHPGATQPFGMVSVNAMGRKIYKEGFPTGYNGEDFYGFSHFHSSGPGTIRWYYNYFLFTPISGNLTFRKTTQKIVKEKASPGYYSCVLDSKIKAETTVSSKSAMHRFTFPTTNDNTLVINLSNYYKAIDSIRVIPEKFPESVSAQFISPTEVEGKVVMDGFPIFFYLRLDKETKKYGFFKNYEIVGEKPLIENTHSDNLGIFFEFDELADKAINTQIGFSFKSLKQAKNNLINDSDSFSFDKSSENATKKWNQYLSKIEVIDADTKAVEQFYSSFYKAILKPANLQGENPFWSSDNYIADLATSWDIYATQMPFVFTFFPEEGQKTAQFYIDLFNQFGRFPPAYLMKGGMPWVFSKQASALGNFILADALARKVPGINWKEALNVMVKTINNERGQLFQQKIPLAPSPTHNQDYAYAAFCTAQVAKAIDENELANRMMELSGLWSSVYDSTGILMETEDMIETELYPKQHFHFYEGNKWNYTYRIWQNMEGLINLQGGKEAFIKNLDWYYNLTPNSTEYQFQGLNNEVDYCSPYAYLYAGRPDRTQQILRIAMEYRFRNTRGGLPGNDDSGAMTSWYVWNAIGLFPIAGQNLLLIGSPTFEYVKMNTENPFEVKTINNSANNIYIQSARLNGKLIDQSFLTFTEFYNGGTLELEMGDKPSKWGSNELPPSY